MADQEDHFKKEALQMITTDIDDKPIVPEGSKAFHLNGKTIVHVAPDCSPGDPLKRDGVRTLWATRSKDITKGCGEKNDGWTCTRIKGHKDVHVAHVDAGELGKVLAKVWDLVPHVHACPDNDIEEKVICICSCGFDLGPHHNSKASEAKPAPVLEPTPKKYVPDEPPTLAGVVAESLGKAHIQVSPTDFEKNTRVLKLLEESYTTVIRDFPFDKYAKDLKPHQKAAFDKAMASVAQTYYLLHQFVETV